MPCHASNPSPTLFGSQAPALVWDEKLAASAKAWASTCTFGFSRTAGVGENLGFGYSALPDAVKSWYAQVRSRVKAHVARRQQLAADVDEHTNTLYFEMPPLNSNLQQSKPTPRCPSMTSATQAGRAAVGCSLRWCGAAPRRSAVPSTAHVRGPCTSATTRPQVG